MIKIYDRSVIVPYKASLQPSRNKTMARPEVIIGKVKEKNGCWGNMAPFPIQYNNCLWKTSEALFQSLRFIDPNVQEIIRNEKSPMAAKMKAKKFKHLMNVIPMSHQDVQNMKLCLTLKIQQHPSLKNLLYDTGSQLIVEDCSKRQNKSGLFWGAALIQNNWIGTNCLGTLWMDIRKQIIDQLL